MTKHVGQFETTDGGARADNVHDLTRARMTRMSPVLEETWRYWTAKRPDGDIPTRESLEPRAMGLILGHALILDRVRPGTVRVRLGGRIPSALMGMEVRGLPVRAFFDLMQRGDAAELIERTFTDPATLELDLTSHGPHGGIAARMLVLPLRDRSGDVTKALSVIVPERLVDDGPRRFKILRQTLCPVDVPAKPIRHAPAPRRHFDAPAQADQASGGRADPMPGDILPGASIVDAAERTPAAPRVPYLRVVK